MSTAALTVVVQSFSYKKTGIPKDPSGNGGGFVFDCRGVLNPGRLDAYKPLTGMDEAVRIYLENETMMPSFIEHIKAILDITMKDYIARNFEHLMISFGCTGGQHRSVYAADVIGEYIAHEYGVAVIIGHCEQAQLEGKMLNPLI